jgi:hypothetical protein
MIGNIWGELTDFQTDNLLYATRFWIRKLSKEQSRAIIKDIHRCFEHWKKDQSDKNGQVVVTCPL